MRYFDHNASSPLLPQARDAWLEAGEKFFGNPSSPHRLGARADRALDEARERLATFLDCDAMDIVWTSGATESNNMVMYHLARALAASAEVWISEIEHPCLLRATASHFPKRHRTIPVTGAGVIDLDWLNENLRRDRPGLVAVMAANNETGVLQPWEEVFKLCREREVPFLCDAAQWIGRLAAKGLGRSEFVSGCAHKFGGPKGVGFLKCPSRGQFQPLLLGGQQEHGRRAGTENVAGVLSMLAALEARESALAKGEEPHRAAWRKKFEETLQQKLPGVEIVGRSSDRLWNTVSALMPDTGGQQRWVVKLDKIGFAVSTGSACASGQEKPSHVLAAMGYGPSETGRVLRFSSGWETTMADWTALAGGLASVYLEMGERGPKLARGQAGGSLNPSVP
ncbi:MAG TPA: cysteine desulfurase family protein [Verrucomicrobiae bacterium]|nr:cysteine desulfurase family protein [Verrucomicrobiae bacterium]